MLRTNNSRKKHLFLNFSDTKILYYMAKILILFLMMFSMIVVIFGLGRQFNLNSTKDKLFGSWDILILNIPTNETDYIQKHEFIENYSIQEIQEKVFLNNDDRVVIGSSDKNFLKIANIDLIEGNMPVNQKEVAVERDYLKILEVRGIGDIVPEKSIVKSLRGYRVCGIVENYSSRWKQVNWDVKYVNCFIKDCIAKERQVYVKASNYVVNDIYINSVNYKWNIEFDNSIIKQYIEKLLYLDILLILIIIYIYFLLNHMIKQKTNIYSMQKQSYRNRRKTNFLIQRLIILPLIFCSINSIYSLIDKFIFNTKLFTDNFDFSGVSINKFGILKLFFDYISYEEVRFFPNMKMDTLIDFIIIILLIILANIFIICIYFVHIDFIIQKNKDFIFMKKYYYQADGFNRKILLKSFRNIIFVEYISYVVLFYIKNQGIIFYPVKIQIFVYGILFLSIIILLRILLINLYMNRKKNAIRKILYLS